MEREVGGEIGMRNTCKPMAVSFQCMTKSTTIKKRKKKKKRSLRDLLLLEQGFLNFTMHTNHMRACKHLDPKSVCSQWDLKLCIASRVPGLLVHVSGLCHPLINEGIEGMENTECSQLIDCDFP